MIIIGKDCEGCKYCTIANEEDAKNIGVCCSARDNRFYRWGQCLECEEREIKK